MQGDFKATRVFTPPKKEGDWKIEGLPFANLRGEDLAIACGRECDVDWTCGGIYIADTVCILVSGVYTDLCDPSAPGKR